MAKKVTKVIIHGQHIEVETDCPDCPENKIHKVVKPNKRDEDLQKELKQKYPWANVSIDKKK